uniref:Prolyl endopeptidase n=1 Tax=Strongyloides venezuelensis TaxID=75913 RepID=A0A0K0F246_STRVS
MRKNLSTVEIINGVKIDDPYRYLEDIYSHETLHFIEQINTMSDNVFKKSKYRNIMKEKIQEYMDFDKYGIYTKIGDYYYYYYSPKGQDNYNLYRKKTLNSKGKLFFKYNQTCGNTPIYYNYGKFSEDGSIYAYGFTNETTQLTTINFKLSNNKILKDTLKDILYTDIAFIFNNNGVIYSSFSNITHLEGEECSYMIYENHSLYYHKMGTPQSEDIKIANDPINKTFLMYGYVSADEKYLFANIYPQFDSKNTIYYYDLRNVYNNRFYGKINMIPLIGNFDANYQIIDSNSEEAIIITDKDAPMKKIIKVKFYKSFLGEKNWKVLIDEEKTRLIESVTVVGKDYLILRCLENVRSILHIYNKHDGTLLQTIDMGLGNIEYISGNRRSNEFFLYFLNPIIPGVIYKGNLDKMKNNEKVKFKKLFTELPNGLKIDDLSIKQIFYKTRDGKNVSMFLLYKNNIKLSRNNPVLFEAYGGFNISYTPYYHGSRIMFVKHFGGIWCLASVRGGNEFGDQWHKEGILNKKNNTFNDVIDGLNFLISNGYTRPSKLGIIGTSNGGMVMAVVSQRRPDLVGAVVIEAAPLDMTRFHLFTYGMTWRDDYGDPDIKKDFDNLLTYSPYYNLKMPLQPLQWPSTLLFTTYYDQIVVPIHTLKYTARLYEILQKGIDYQYNPIITTVIMNRSEHGEATSYHNYIEDNVKIFSFLQQALNLTWIN